MASFSGFYRYIVVLVVSACVGRYLFKMTQGKAVITTLDKGLVNLGTFTKGQFGITLPALSVAQIVGLGTVAQTEKLLWQGLMYLPVVAVLGFRKHLLLYFLFFLLVVALDSPLYVNNWERFFELHAENILMMGLSGYAASM